MKKLCKCGCGKEIIIKEYHSYYGIPDYIHGHNRFGKKHSRITKLKISKSEKGKIVSEKTKKLISIANKNKKHSENTKLKISQKLKGRVMSEDTKQKRRNFLLGKTLSNDIKEKISKTLKKKYRNGEIKIPERKNYIYYYKNTKFRSSWEVNIAKAFDNFNIFWKYEKYRFNLKNTTYTPDFYIPEYNCFIEVKGHRKESLYKTIELSKTYKIIIIEKDLHNLINNKNINPKIIIENILCNYKYYKRIINDRS